MLSDADLEALLADIESDRAERKESIADKGKIRQAICAFANDLPDHRRPSVLFVGARDDGSCAGLPIDDQLLLTLADMRSDGNILPFPSMTVQKRVLSGGELAVIEVQPSDAPPVRFNGRAWIRVGPRRATATAEEERRLSEKRRVRDIPFDLSPLTSVGVEALDLDLFMRSYLPAAIDPDVLAANERTTEQQLAAMRFTTPVPPFHPTVTGVLVVGATPTDHIPGAYVQFLRVSGRELTDPISDQKELHGPLVELPRRIDDLLTMNIAVRTEIAATGPEVRRPDYPQIALQQLVRNAIMHRDYATTHAPVRITWFEDRVEFQNPGGPFGQVTLENFGTPGITDYRNPHVAEALKSLGYVQRFGVGIALAQKALSENGNPPPEFQLQPNHVLAIVRRRP
jgi:ATP-dependent DNA helicase RecG